MGSSKASFITLVVALQDARRIIELGFYLGIRGMVSFKNVGLGQVVARLHWDHLVLEIDALYLAGLTLQR